MNHRKTNEGLKERLPGLIAAARTGDQQAFTALYEATKQEVYRTARAVLQSEQMALDIQQDTFVYTFTHLDKLEDPAKLRPWLRAIAVNMARTALRKQTPVLFTELETEEGSGLPEQADPSPEASPEMSLDRKETAALVNEILDGLSAGQRAAVGMYYYEQMPVNEIAEALGVNAGTVKTQLARGRKKIEEAIRGLEKRGIKLYGLSPLPFLVALMKRQSPAEEAGRAALAQTMEKAGISAGAKAVAAAAGSGGAASGAGAVAVHLGRGFFETTVGKLVLGVIVAGVIGGGAMGYRWYENRRSEPTIKTTEELETPHTIPTAPTSDTEALISIAAPYDDSMEDLTTEPEPTEPQPTEPAESTEATEPEPTEPKPTEPSGETETLLTGTCGENLTWTYSPKTGVLTVTGSGPMSIPAAYNHRPWSDFCDSVTTLELSDGLTSICDYAFKDFTALTVVRLPASLTEIGSSAFSYCEALKSVAFPEGLKTIGNSAFDGCSSLRAVTIPASVKSIEISAFSRCAGLREINVAAGNLNYSSLDGVLFDKARTMLIQYPGGKTIASYTVPESVSEIGWGAFEECESLKQVKLPNALTCIDWAAFCGCTGLTSITIPDGVSYISSYAFFECPGIKRVTIPYGVQTIAPEAFGYIDGGKTEGFTICGKTGSAAQTYAEGNGFAFAPIQDTTLVSGNCGDKGSNLTWSMDGETGCLTISGSGAMADYYLGSAPWFDYRERIVSVSLPAGLTQIGNNAFRSCGAVSAVDLPEGLKRIGESAFRDCAALTDAALPARLTSIGREAFYGCEGLTSLSLPAGLQALEESVFYGCTGLKNVSLSGRVSRIGASAFACCERLSELKLPAGLTEIGESAFASCKSLTEMKLPAGLTDIEAYAFACCERLTDVYFPESLTAVSNGAFYDCKMLLWVSIPDSVTKIEDYAFGYQNEDDGIKRIDGFTIYGTEGSAAHRYAGLNGFLFALVGD